MSGILIISQRMIIYGDLINTHRILDPHSNKWGFFILTYLYYMNLQEHIRRVLKEETLKTKLIHDIKNDGWFNVSPYVGGDDNLKKVTDIHSALSFMKLFSDLKGVVSEQEPLMRLYKNDNGENVFVVVSTINGDVYIRVNYELIYSPLSLFLDTNRDGERKHFFLKQWFKDKYNITEDIVYVDHFYVWDVN